MSVESKLIELYAQMAALTAPLCGNCGDDPCSKSQFRCCDPLACENARQAAQTWGVKLEDTAHATLPFMGDGGCTVAPHLRPRCTMFLCLTNPAAHSDAYRVLRARIAELERERGALT